MIRLQFSYGAEQAVRDVSFSVPNGEVFAIVGESGSGKSTLVRAAFGMLKQASISGQILLNGTDISTLSDSDWRQLRGTKISMIFQNPSAYLNPNRTVENHFKDLFRAHGESYDVSRVIDMLNLVHLTDGERILQSYPFQLSGGMQQRLAIAIESHLEAEYRICRRTELCAFRYARASLCIGPYERGNAGSWSNGDYCNP